MLILWFVAVTLMFEDVSFGSALDAIIVTARRAQPGRLRRRLPVAGVERGQRRGATKQRWPAKVWSIALVIAAATVLHVAFAYKLIGFATNY